ncbi:hypothetical protein FB107DRAFT_270510 [Schizophyllum commune]
MPSAAVPDYTCHIHELMRIVERYFPFIGESSVLPSARDIYNALVNCEKSRQPGLFQCMSSALILWSMHVTTAWPRPSLKGPRVYGVPHSSIACAYFFLEILSLAFPDWPVDITEFIPPPESSCNPWFAQPPIPAPILSADGSLLSDVEDPVEEARELFEDMRKIIFWEDEYDFKWLLNDLRQRNMLPASWTYPIMGQRKSSARALAHQSASSTLRWLFESDTIPDFPPPFVANPDPSVNPGPDPAVNPAGCDPSTSTMIQSPPSSSRALELVNSYAAELAAHARATESLAYSHLAERTAHPHTAQSLAHMAQSLAHMAQSSARSYPANSTAQPASLSSPEREQASHSEHDQASHSEGASSQQVTLDMILEGLLASGLLP